MATKMKQRNRSFWSTNWPLTSKRAMYILSDKEDSKKLAESVRAYKKGESASFKVSKRVHAHIHQ